MPATSASVSVGRPIMKYSFTFVQPLLKAIETVRLSSSSCTFLLMTSRRRCVPASGAKVRPLLRTEAILSVSSVEKLSTRSDGSETLTRSSSVQVCSVSSSSNRQP